MNIAPEIADEEVEAKARVVTRPEFEMKNSFTPGRFALFLGLLVAILFANVIFGGHTFFYRDYGAFGYPLAQYHRDCFWRGELPVWNSLSNCGMPYLAQWNTMTLYPLSLIYLLLPLPWSVSFFCLAHLFLAGLGMYLLALLWTNNRFAAAVAGVAFSFNGLTLHCLMWPNNIAGLALMPWVILAMEHAWQKGGRAVIAAGLVGAVQMLSGAPEIILFTWLMGGLLMAAKLFSDRADRWRNCWRTGCVAAITTALAAAQLLPFLYLLGHSQRDSSFGVSTWAMPAWGWLNLILPLFRSIPSPANVYFQVDQEWTSSYYPGAAVLLLAILALRASPARRVWLLWAVAVTGLVLALGERGYVYSVFRKAVPFLGFMRFPIKFVVLTLFVLPLLAASAIATLNADSSTVVEKIRTGRRWALAIAGAFAVLIAAGVVFSYSHPWGNLQWSAVWQNALLRIVFLAALVAVLFRSLTISDRRVQFWLQTMFLLGLALDVWTHMPNQNPAITQSVYARGLLAEQLDPRCAGGEARVMMTKPTHDLLYHRMVQEPLKDYMGRRGGLFGNCNLLDGIATPDGFYSLYLFEQRQIWSKLFFAPPTNFPAPLADFVGLAQVTANPFDWTSRPSALPRVTIGAQPLFLGPQEIFDGLGDQAFDPRGTVYLPLEARASISATRSPAARILKTTSRSGRITVETESPQAAMLVIAESFYKGWRAYVDGKRLTLWRANHAFQAVEVPAGQHQVTFAFEDKYLFYGSLISGATLLGCLAWWLRKRNSTTESK